MVRDAILIVFKPPATASVWRKGLGEDEGYHVEQRHKDVGRGVQVGSRWACRPWKLKPNR